MRTYLGFRMLYVAEDFFFRTFRFLCVYRTGATSATKTRSCMCTLNVCLLRSFCSSTFFFLFLNSFMPSSSSSTSSSWSTKHLPFFFRMYKFHSEKIYKNSLQKLLCKLLVGGRCLLYRVLYNKNIQTKNYSKLWENFSSVILKESKKKRIFAKKYLLLSCTSELGMWKDNYIFWIRPVTI